VLFWKPQVALLVNETTLLPVLTKFAPAATLLDRVPTVVAVHLHAHGVPTMSSRLNESRWGSAAWRRRPVAA